MKNLQVAILQDEIRAKVFVLSDVDRLKSYATELKLLIFNKQNRFKVVTFLKKLNRVVALILLIIETIDKLKN